MTPRIKQYPPTTNLKKKSENTLKTIPQMKKKLKK